MIVATLLSLIATAALGNDIDIHVDNFFVEGGTSTVVLKITNNTGSQTFDNVFVSCAFLDKDNKAIDIGKAWVTDLAPREVAYDKARIPTAAGVQYASCSVD